MDSISTIMARVQKAQVILDKEFGHDQWKVSRVYDDKIMVIPSGIARAERADGAVKAMAVLKKAGLKVSWGGTKNRERDTFMLYSRGEKTEAREGWVPGTKIHVDLPARTHGGFQVVGKAGALYRLADEVNAVLEGQFGAKTFWAERAGTYVYGGVVRNDLPDAKAKVASAIAALKAKGMTVKAEDEKHFKVYLPRTLSFGFGESAGSLLSAAWRLEEGHEDLKAKVDKVIKERSVDARGYRETPRYYSKLKDFGVYVFKIKKGTAGYSHETEGLMAAMKAAGLNVKSVPGNSAAFEVHAEKTEGAGDDGRDAAGDRAHAAAWAAKLRAVLNKKFDAKIKVVDISNDEGAVIFSEYEQGDLSKVAADVFKYLAKKGLKPGTMGGRYKAMGGIRVRYPAEDAGGFVEATTSANAGAYAVPFGPVLTRPGVPDRNYATVSWDDYKNKLGAYAKGVGLTV